MVGADRSRALEVVRGVGWCEQPIRLRANHQQLNTTDGELTRPEIYVACESRRASRCGPCSRLYQGDAYFILLSGLLGTKGVGKDVLTQPAAVVTLTAPGADVFGVAGHFRDKHGRRLCNPRRSPRICTHGVDLRCGKRHAAEDPLLGAPLCVDCFDYAAAVAWNGHASQLWNVFTTYLRRAVPGNVEYARTVEPQRRGLVHMHAVVRFDLPVASRWTGQDLETAIRDVASRVRVGEHRFGSQLHVDFVPADIEARQRTAGYLAKYATASAADFQAKVGVGNRQHLARIRKTAVPVLYRHYMDGRLRRGAQLNIEMRRDCMRRAEAKAFELGYRGHFMSTSGNYSTTFGALRSARREFAASEAASRPEVLVDVGTTGWTFLQQGYVVADRDADRLANLAARPVAPAVLDQAA